MSHPDVLTAGRRVRAGSRLFAVGVADDGAVALSELRHGAPIARARCKVEPSRALPEPAKLLRPTITGSGPWRGDVEPIGFPFRFGLTGGLARAMDFDRTGTWVLCSGRFGTLHAARADGSRFEVLPRAFYSGPRQALSDVGAIFGTLDGFVVAGRIANHAVLAHYDFLRRTVRLRTVVALPVAHAYRLSWSHFPELRSVVVREGVNVHAIDLDAESGPTARSEQARERARAGEKGADQHSVELDLDAFGRLTVHGAQPAWRPFTPLADGRPELAGHMAGEARLAGSVLAALFSTPQASTEATLRLYRGPDGEPLGAHPVKPSAWQFVLSADGALLAREVGPARLEVRETQPGGHLFSFPTGRFHNDVRVELGAVWLRIYTGSATHVLQWHDRVLRSSLGGGTVIESPPARSHRISSLPPLAAYDPSRFTQAAHGAGMTVLVDVFGHVVVLDRSGERLIAIFFAYRRQLAAWMPDGTRWGSSALLEGLPTAGAAERLGVVLHDASVGRGAVSA